VEEVPGQECARHHCLGHSKKRGGILLHVQVRVVCGKVCVFVCMCVAHVRTTSNLQEEEGEKQQGRTRGNALQADAASVLGVGRERTSAWASARDSRARARKRTKKGRHEFLGKQLDVITSRPKKYNSLEVQHLPATLRIDTLEQENFLF